MRPTSAFTAAAAGVLFTVSVAQAQVLFTTQEDFAGFDGGTAITTSASATSFDGSTTNGLGNATAAGAAGTDGGLQLVWNSGTYDTIGGPGLQDNATALAALGTSNTGTGFTAGSGTIQFDFTQPPAGTGNYFELNLLLNYDDNFGQFSGTNVDNGDGTFTRTIDYTINDTTANSYFQLGFIYNSNYDTDTPFFVDNVRISGGDVPEPASLGLIGLGGLLVGRRRRV